ncbi:MAG: hypothetical protein L0Y71_00355 [Gemmataceae bacterium]|nr:hypothetical protein [Gemmataceae bacterium]
MAALAAAQRRESDAASSASAAPRRRFRFSLLRLFGFLSLIAIVLAVCSNAWRVPRRDEYLDVAIHARGVDVDGQPVSDVELGGRLADFRARWDRWYELYGRGDDAFAGDAAGPEDPVGVPDGFPTVRLTIDDDVCYVDLCRCLNECNAAELYHVEFEHDGRTCAFVARMLPDYGFFPIRYTPPEELEYTFFVRITADAQGNLVQILTESGPCSTPEALHAIALKFVRNGPRAALPYIRSAGQIDCDAGLRFEQLGPILAAVTTYARSDGTYAPLLDWLEFVDPQKKAAEIAQRRADRDTLLRRIEREGDPRGFLRSEVEWIESFLERAAPLAR